MNAVATELKALTIAFNKKPAKGENDPFSETLVKQLLRQGEDRKASIEDYKLVQNRVAEMKKSQKKQRDMLLQVTKSLEIIEDNQRKTGFYVDKVRISQERQHA